MNEEDLKQLLSEFKTGRATMDDLLEKLRSSSFLYLGHSMLDLDREARSGFPEVVFAGPKRKEELLEIVASLHSRLGRVLVTRLDDAQRQALQTAYPAAVFHEECGVAVIGPETAVKLKGNIAIVSAGTGDGRVAREAEVTAQFVGLEVVRVNDVGIAGLERLFCRLPILLEQDLLLVIAGMEGALPSVIAGLCDVPVIGVPTSVGYGASFSGAAALLGMLASCSPGLTVVNIDNGFGAALAAAKIIRRVRRTDAP